MSKLRIPDDNADIRAEVRRRIIRDIALIVLVRAVVFTPAYFYGYYTQPVNVFGIIFVEVICLLPLFKTRIWRWFTSARAFEGVVAEVKRREGKKISNPYIHGSQTPTKAMRKTPVAGRFRRMVRVNIQKIKVRLPDGRLRRVRYVCPDGALIPQYEVGDRVRHYYGTVYMQKLPDIDDIFPDPETIPNICVMCGATNEADDEICDFCGISLPERTR